MGIAETSESPFKTRHSFYRFIRALKQEVGANSLNCINLTKTILVYWLAKIAPELPISADLSNHKGQLTEAGENFLKWLIAQSTLDGMYWLSSAYAILSGDSHQKSHAMYFTPPSITKRMLDDLVNEQANFTKHVFYDPACGGAAFLSPIAARIRDELIRIGYTSAEIIAHVEKHVLGSELDPVLCLLSENFLRVILRKQISETKKEPHFRIICADSLLSPVPFEGRIDAIVCNPPYRKLSKAELLNYKKLYGGVIESQPNLYTLFIALCLKTVAQNGLVKLISPMSFVSGKTFGNLRAEMQRAGDIVSFGIVGERLNVFIDVEQETIITLIRKRASVGIPAATEVFEVCRDGSRKRIGDTFIAPGTGVWAIPRRKEDSDIIERARGFRARIFDYGYRARIGAFVWNRDPKHTYFTLNEARKAKAAFVVPLIWSSDISSGKLINLTKRRNNLNEPRYVDIGAADHQSLVRRAAILLQRVTSSDQPRRLIASPLDVSRASSFPGFVGENHVVILEAERDLPTYDTEILMNVFRTEQVDRYFRCISGSTNVSVFELNQLPLPCPECIRLSIESGASPSDAIASVMGIATSDCDHLPILDLK